MGAMYWEEFVTRFEEEFVPTIEVQQLVRGFQGLRQTTETITKITARFQERDFVSSAICSNREDEEGVVS